MMPLKLMVKMADTYRTEIAIVHEQSFMPYTFRTVQIELTEEQMKLLEPREVGARNGEPVFEERAEAWLEIA